MKEQKVKCKKCGKEWNLDEGIHCPKCGLPLIDNPIEKNGTLERFVGKRL